MTTKSSANKNFNSCLVGTGVLYDLCERQNVFCNFFYYFDYDHRNCIS